jgi:hypothetical protein
MDFEKRLQRAVERGQQAHDDKARRQAREAVNEDELKSLHSQYRLSLSEHIEACVHRLADHFPGFRYESIYGERGWGASISRDDVRRGERGRDNFFSRLEMTIRPFSEYHVLELTAKGTVLNKEIFNRSHFQLLADADPESFTEMIDLWILEYAELFAAKH